MSQPRFNEDRYYRYPRAESQLSSMMTETQKRPWRTCPRRT
jgi:hypothetical protein